MGRARLAFAQPGEEMVREAARSGKELRMDLLRCRQAGHFLEADDVRLQAPEAGDQKRVATVDGVADVPNVQGKDLDVSHDGIGPFGTAAAIVVGLSAIQALRPRNVASGRSMMLTGMSCK